MRRRVFVVAGEYSANPRHLPPERRSRAFLSEPHPQLSDEEVSRLFFRFPNRSEDGRATPEDWKREFGLQTPIGLTDLFASAAHRAITSLHQHNGGSYQQMREAITHLYVTSMPGLDPNEKMNIGLVPQALRAVLRLSRRVVAQFVVGTSDSGAWAFAQAVRTARREERPVTILVVAGQILPSGYASQYQIRTVLGEVDQALGLDMLAVGDLLMDGFRRNLGLSREEVEAFLARVGTRKLQAGAYYPAGIVAGKPFKRMARRTPYFDASDIAAPCCGAAATIVTSDEALVARVASSRGQRYRSAPVTEVLGVGEGSSAANLVQRASPLFFATAVREALADTADDARLPLSSFLSCAFGVAHDAFPSIELAFMLAMGLSWERAAERMAEGWPNPLGGLLSFGHALGASGLVQVNKTHHLFCGDQRYVKEGPAPRSGFREGGAVAFTTSVGGPLSHIVAGLFCGGFAEVPRIPEQELLRRSDPEYAPHTRQWWAKRHQLRQVLPSYWERVRGRIPGEPWFVEGATYVSVRSALGALSPEEVGRLCFDGLERLIAPEHLEEVRAQLREVVLVVLGEAERVASMFDAFRLLSDEVRALSKSWRKSGLLAPVAVGMAEGALADRVKDCLRVPLVVLAGSGAEPARRRVLFLPVFELTYEKVADIDLLSSSGGGRLTAVRPDPALLPFWNVRATRAAGQSAPQQSISPMGLVDQLLAKRDRMESAPELELLRLWFAPDPPRPVLEKALRAAGFALAEPLPVRAVVYLGEIADRGPLSDSGAAHELLGRAAREALAFVQPHQTHVTQNGEMLALAAFERPPFRTSLDEGLIGVARFGRELARAAQQHGVVIRAAICTGEGAVYEDVHGQPGLASAASAKALELLDQLRSGPVRPVLAVQGAGMSLERLQKRLQGWQTEPHAKPDFAVFWHEGPHKNGRLI
jgi:hypothetical protein